MPVIIVPGTPHAEEILKWEYAEYQIGGEPGKRGPRVFIEFPKMLYRAGRNEQNQIDILKTAVADDRDHQARLESQGFVEGPDKAIEKAEASEREIAKLAANRAAQDRRLSPQARQEAAEYEASVPEHVAEVPVKPRGRPRKETVDA